MQIQSSEELGDRGWLLLYAPPKTGKTVTAATISEQCPDTLPAKEKTHLKDILWLQYDMDGTQALKDVNLSVDVVNFTECVTYKDIVKAEESFFGKKNENIQKLVDAGYKTIVVDTFTARDDLVTAYFAGIYADPKLSGRLWNSVKGAGEEFARQMKSLPFRIIWLTHAKEIYTPMADEEATHTKQSARSLDAAAGIEPRITGSFKNILYGLCSYIWAVRCKRRKGQPAVRTVLTKTASNFVAGSRAENRLDSEEPANLKYIFNKLEKEIK